MKKTFKTFALMLLTALAFSSCVDVPAPYNLPDKGNNSGGGGETTEDKGTPVTCAEAVELTNALADGATSTTIYTITGYITQVVGDVSKNQQTFWMADSKDGGKVFEAYWANLPDGVTAFTVGTKVKITGKLTKYVNSNTGVVTPEIKNATVTILEDNGGGGGSGDEGTPVSCAEAVQLTNALADGATSTTTYTVTGYITQVVGDVSKNQQTFWIADTKDGGKVFEAYWANLPSGVSAFTVGMKVKITGKLMKYVNSKTGEMTPEIKNANVVILEDGGGSQGGGSSTGEEGTPVSCAEAVQLTSALTDGATSTVTYTVTGYITEVLGSVSTKTGTPQQSFWMADSQDGGKVFEAYYANVPSGVSAFTVGMKVKITGKLTKYVKDGVMTPEIKNATVVILESGDGGGQGGDGGDQGGGGGDTVSDLVNGDFESWVSDTEPTGWIASGGAAPGNAVISKSTEARNGSFACLVGAPGTQNKRLATQKMTLEAGSYTFSFYAKSTTGDVCQTRGGYAAYADGTVPSNGYHYASYTDINNNGWTLVSYDFELAATTELSLLVMNPKGSSYSVSQDILVDDATLVKK